MGLRVAFKLTFGGATEVCPLVIRIVKRVLIRLVPPHQGFLYRCRRRIQSKIVLGVRLVERGSVQGKLVLAGKVEKL